MTWKEYEEAVFVYFRSKYHEYDVRKDVKLDGKKSKTLRQIDVLIDGYIADHHIQIAVECKRWKAKVDVADVGAFIDELNDVRIACGIIVARHGFTPAAFERAQSEKDLQLHILDFESLPQDHGFYANPYRGDAGAILSAPTGWIVDGNTTPEEKEFALCFLYPTRLGKKLGWERPEIMYLNMYPVTNYIDMLVEEQNERVLVGDPKAQIHMWDEVIFRRELVIRKIEHANKDVVEYTAFLQTDRFFCYVVSAALKEERHRNLIRLKYVMKNITFVTLEGVDPTNCDDHWKALFHRAEIPAGSLITTLQ